MSIRTARAAAFALVIFGILAGGNVSAQFGIFKKKKEEPKKTYSIYDVDTIINGMIPAQRQVFHNRIEKEQRRADVSDGSVDGSIYFSEDTTLTNSLTRSILTDVDRMQALVENLEISADPSIENEAKIRYLSAIYLMVNKYNSNLNVEPAYYRRIVQNMRELIIADYEKRLEAYARANANIYTLENSTKMLEMLPETKAYVFGQVARQMPEKMIKRLNEFAKEPYACEVVKAAARIVPIEIYNYASSTNYELLSAVRNCEDPLVKTILRITDESNYKLSTLSFLGDIHNGRLTIEQADSISANPDIYYANLVRLKMENDTLGRAVYTKELARSGLRYVREMNDLHEEPDAKRFKCIERMPPETLYYLMIYGQDEIYTSSFLGTFKRMTERMAPLKGDEFLAKLNYDRFRTFLRMCAGYNTLSTFLATMEPEKKSEVMSNFIAGLEKGGDNDLEDAVDVADAFGSVKDSALAGFLRNRIKDNYEASFKARSRKGMIVYGLMAAIFDGSKALSSQDEVIRQSDVLGLPPVNLVPFSSLTTDSGVVYIQVYFYGDEDGKMSYNNFMGNFRNGKWKIQEDKFFTTISSIQGKKIVYFANRALPEPGDEEAQMKLNNYLAEKEITPTFIIHRGHSYHLPTTMSKLAKENKIIILGSCGGYHNLGVVLDRSPDAHIISSKQTGMAVINDAIIRTMNDHMLAGKDINWINIWKEVELSMKGKDVKEKFDDYVPPYKNLGVLFIKSYRRLTTDLAAVR
ncbi:MAG: hypothetical protein JNL72_03030 [Flavipsychrobacter sp.]|nr:hypothetical protein [Flavipsychrobacter sp.]